VAAAKQVSVMEKLDMNNGIIDLVRISLFVPPVIGECSYYQNIGKHIEIFRGNV
jgi:hypothetical protein